MALTKTKIEARPRDEGRMTSTPFLITAGVVVLAEVPLLATVTLEVTEATVEPADA